MHFNLHFVALIGHRKQLVLKLSVTESKEKKSTSNFFIRNLAKGVVLKVSYFFT